MEKHKEDASIVAGGTDLVPRIMRGQVRPKFVVDLSKFSELNYVKRENGVVSIGALTRISELSQSRVLDERCESLRQVCQILASPAIRNMATVGGNIAAPGSHRDLLTVLLSLGGQAVLKSRKGSRTLPIEDLLLDGSRLDLRAEEIITEVRFQELLPLSSSSFGRVSRRLSFAVPLVSLAVFLELDSASKKINEVRLWFNHLRGDFPERARHAETALENEIIDESTVDDASQALSAELRPLSDFKASSQYRRKVAIVLFKDQIAHCSEMIAKGSR